MKDLLKNIDKYIYTNKFNHVYLYDAITNESVLNVKLAIDEYNKTQNKNGIKLKPKTIVLHINSPGGYVISGIALMRVINKSRVPVIVLVEGTSASAATFVTVAAKYRIISPYAVMLIHQYFQGIVGQREDILFEVNVGEKLSDFLYQIYAEHTKIPKKKIEEILKRDVFFTPEECLKYGMIDKVLKPIPPTVINNYYYKNPEYDLPAKIVNIKTNFNNLYLYHDRSNAANEEMSYQVAIGVVITIQNILISAEDGVNNEVKFLETGVPKPILLHISDMGQFRYLYEVVPIINTILLSPIPIYSIIDGPATIMTILYSIVCHKRFIYKHAFITINLVKTWEGAFKFEDIKKNTELYRKVVRILLKKYTKIPREMMRDLFKERFYISAQKSVEYGICDEILD